MTEMLEQQFIELSVKVRTAIHTIDPIMANSVPAKYRISLKTGINKNSRRILATKVEVL